MSFVQSERLNISYIACIYIAIFVFEQTKRSNRIVTNFNENIVQSLTRFDTLNLIQVVCQNDSLF